jgi:hypothetical protein
MRQNFFRLQSHLVAFCTRDQGALCTFVRNLYWKGDSEVPLVRMRDSDEKEPSKVNEVPGAPQDPIFFLRVHHIGERRWTM